MIKRKGGGLQETFTVRRVTYGVGVERTFPLHSPRIDKIEVIRRGKVRRANYITLGSEQVRQPELRIFVKQCKGLSKSVLLS